MAADLPPAIRAAIAGMMEGVSRKDLAARAASLSESYRGGAGSRATIRNREDVLAYLATRMPATYAATAAALSAAAAQLPGFTPETVLDVGAGPGTASYTALEQWPEVSAVTMIDGSTHLLHAAEELTKQLSHPALRTCSRIVADAARFGRPLPPADLVLAAYVLAETQPADFVARLWEAATGALVIVEPGTPDGFQRIRAARAALIAAGAIIAAPCPHERACPIVAPDWCHFGVRLQRSRDHRLAKGADAPFEDEKYAYVVAARAAIPPEPRRPRILAPPHATRGAIAFKLCMPDGEIAVKQVERRDRNAFAAARRARWGDTA